MGITQIRGGQIADNSLTPDDVVYSLDDAYDNGGSGAGRQITADSGAVIINGGSSTALIVSGTLEIFGAPSSGPAIRIVQGDLELNNSIKLEAGNGQNLQLFHDGANATMKNSTGHFLLYTPNNARIELAVSGTTAASQIRLRRTLNGVVDTLFQVQGDGNILYGTGSIGTSTFYHNVVVPRIQSRQHSQTLQTLADAATVNWNVDQGATAQVTLGGDRTIASPTNIVAGGTYTLIVKQDATGNRVATWGAAYKFEGGSKSLSTAPNAVDVATFISDGTTLWGTLLKNMT
jgi:hypothetical protein